MSDGRLIHVQIENPTQAELADVRDLIEDALQDYDGHGKVVVSDQRMNLAEVPALDDYADELAERVAEKIVQE